MLVAQMTEMRPAFVTQSMPFSLPCKADRRSMPPVVELAVAMKRMP